MDSLSSNLSNSAGDHVCYFFFTSTNFQTNAVDAFSAMLFQLLSNTPSLLRHCMQKYDEMSNNIRQLHCLWLFFKTIALDPLVGKLYLIIDGLDECEKESRKALLDLVGKFYRDPSPPGSSSSCINFFFTSRPEVFITDLLADPSLFSEIRLHGEDETEAITHDVSLVIDARLDSLVKNGRMWEADAALLKTAFKLHADKSFLWVQLALNQIEDSGYEKPEAELVAILDELPEGLTELYDFLLQKIPKKYRSGAKRILEIIIGAYRPLTLEEINLTYSITASIQEVSRISLYRDIERTIRGILKSMVRVIRSTVHLVHSSARDFVLRLSNTQAFYRVDHDAAHLYLAGTCITYLSMVDFTHRPFFDQGGDLDVKFGLISKQFPLWQYSSTFGLKHLAAVQNYGNATPLLEAVALLSKPGSVVLSNWFPYALKADDVLLSALADTLIVAAYFGLSQLIPGVFSGRFSESLPSVHTVNVALLYVSIRGHTDFFKVLLQHSPDFIDDQTPRHDGAISSQMLLNPETLRNWSNEELVRPVFLACQSGHAALVEQLVSDGRFDVNFFGRQNGMSPLFTATVLGNTPMVKALLSCPRVEVNKKTFADIVPLAYLAMDGENPELFKEMLANEQVDVNWKFRGRTILSSAVSGGNVEIVKSIISCSRFKDLDPSPSKYSSISPALFALVANRHEIFKILLDSSRVTFTGAQIQDLVVKAIIANRHEILKILLDSSRVTFTGAQIQDLVGKAIVANRPDSLKLLLDSGQLTASEAQIEQFFYSVFTFEEFSPMARLLLKHSPAWSAYALLACARRGHVEFFKYLISCGQVDGNERNNIGETSLLIASKHGHQALVNLLLSRSNTDVNATDCSGMSALHWAVEYGHVKIIDSILACERFDAEIALDAQRSGSSSAASNLPSNDTKLERDGENLGPIKNQISNEVSDATVLSSDIECQIDPESEDYTILLKSAALAGNTFILRCLLPDKVNARSEHGAQAVLYASTNGHTEFVRMLLNCGAAAEYRGPDNYTALINAAGKGCQEIVELLLKHSANPHSITDFGDSAISYAALFGHKEIVKLLINSGVNVNWQHAKIAATALHFAASNGHRETSELLIDAGAVIESRNTYGKTPLLVAAMANHVDVVVLLLERGANVHAHDPDTQRNALHEAANYPNSSRRMVETLIRAGIDVHSVDSNGYRPLSHAVGGFNTNPGSKEVFDYLCEIGVDVEAKSNDGSTALHLAAIQGHVTSIQWLLDSGADVNARGFEDRTPLIYAISNRRDGACRLLIERGASLEARSHGYTPLMWAAGRNSASTVELLLAGGAEPNSCGSTNHTPLEVALWNLAESAVDVLLRDDRVEIGLNPSNEFGASPLLLACSLGLMKSVRSLLRRGADVNAKDTKYGGTALHAIARSGNKPDQAEIAKIILPLLANPFEKDDKGKTALDVAKELLHFDLVRVIVRGSHK